MPEKYQLIYCSRETCSSHHLQTHTSVSHCSAVTTVNWGLALLPVSSSSSAALRYPPEGSFWRRASSRLRWSGCSQFPWKRHKHADATEEWPRSVARKSKEERKESCSQEFTFLRLLHLTEVCGLRSLHRPERTREKVTQQHCFTDWQSSAAPSDHKSLECSGMDFSCFVAALNLCWSQLIWPSGWGFNPPLYMWDLKQICLTYKIHAHLLTFFRHNRKSGWISRSECECVWLCVSFVSVRPCDGLKTCPGCIPPLAPWMLG